MMIAIYAYFTVYWLYFALVTLCIGYNVYRLRCVMNILCIDYIVNWLHYVLIALFIRILYTDYIGYMVYCSHCV